MLIDRKMTKFSLTPYTDFMTLEEHLKKYLVGYKYNEEKCIVETDSAPNLNFEKTMGLFKKKIASMSEEEKKEVEQFESLLETYGSLYCEEEKDHEQVLLISQIRSGNSFFRRITENITGIATGSCYPNSFSMNFAFVAYGFKGEYITDNRTYMNKTHYPMFISGAKELTGSKIVVLTRNPFD